MTIPQTPVFDGISPEECRRIYECFGVQERCFKPEELVYDFDSGRRTIGVLATGSAIVERVDQRGDRTILEHLQPGGVFGEMLMFRNVLGDSVDVTCEKPCCVWFFPEEKLENRCEKNCGHHNRMIENMFHLISEKASALSERVRCLAAAASGISCCAISLCSRPKTAEALPCPFPSVPWRTTYPPTAAP